ncbi:uncharacterized protein L201_001674 [Kwoniella dendrophila CBS 6074]|uniref:F-box domain-containing protein n=1 Tax=Kwoniella dendrophila CBS 6074 TaxID=1295534 RepID=A0AAX4JQI6_9TREE
MGLEIYGYGQEEFSDSDDGYGYGYGGGGYEGFTDDIADEDEYYAYEASLEFEEMERRRRRRDEGYDSDPYSSDQEESMSSSSSSSSENSDLDEEDIEEKAVNYTSRKEIRRKSQLTEIIEIILLILNRWNKDGFIENEIRRIEEKSITDEQKRLERLAKANQAGLYMPNNGHGQDIKGKGKIKLRNGNSINSKKSKTVNKFETPWTRLIELIRSLKVDGNADKDPLEVRICLGIAHHLIQEKILRLLDDKSYIHTLSGIEARTARSFRSTKIQLPEGFRLITSNSNTAILLQQIPNFLLLRLIRYSLHYDQDKPHKLDLSHLPYINVNPVLESLDFQSLLELVGSSSSNVRYVDFSNNKMDNQSRWSPTESDFPNFHIFPFPNIQIIDLRNIPTLKTLPLSIVRLTRLRRILCKGTPIIPKTKSSSDDDYLYGYDYGQPNQNSDCVVRMCNKDRKTSLVNYCILSLNKLKYQILDHRNDSDGNANKRTKQIDSCAKDGRGGETAIEKAELQSEPEPEVGSEKLEKNIKEYLPSRHLVVYEQSYRCERCFEFQIIEGPLQIGHGNGSSVTKREDQKGGFSWVFHNSMSIKQSGWIFRDPKIDKGTHAAVTNDSRQDERTKLKSQRKVILVSGKCCLKCKKEIATKHSKLNVFTPKPLRADMGWAF